MKTPDLAGALAAMKTASRGPGIKSPVYAWLASHHDALTAAFAKQAPSWKALAKYLADGGITNANGVAPTPTTVRSSWLRVEADIARKRGRRIRLPQPDASSSPPPAPVLGDGLGDEDAPDFSSFVKG